MKRRNFLQLFSAAVVAPFVSKAKTKAEANTDICDEALRKITYEQVTKSNKATEPAWPQCTPLTEGMVPPQCILPVDVDAARMADAMNRTLDKLAMEAIRA